MQYPLILCKASKHFGCLDCLARYLIDPRCILQHDNAPKHTVRVIKSQESHDRLYGHHRSRSQHHSGSLGWHRKDTRRWDRLNPQSNCGGFSKMLGITSRPPCAQVHLRELGIVLNRKILPAPAAGLQLSVWHQLEPALPLSGHVFTLQLNKKASRCRWSHENQPAQLKYDDPLN